MPLETAFGSGFSSGSQAVAQGLSLKQRQQEQEQKIQQQKIKDFDNRRKQFGDFLDKTVKSIWTNNPEDAPKKIEELRNNPEIQKQMQIFSVLGQAYGENPQITNMMFDSYFDQPSPKKVSEQKAQETGIIEAAKSEAKGDLKTFIDPTGNHHTIRSSNEEAINTAIAAGWVEDKFTSERTPAASKKAEIDKGEAISTVRSGAEALKELNNTPGAVGLPGIITDVVGGFFGSIGMDSLEEGISEVFSGSNAESVKKARSKFITFQGSMAKAILNDSRISDYERRILNDAIGATTATASPSKIKGAYKQILATSITLARRKQIEAGSDVLDLSTPDGINALGRQLVNSGVTNKDAVNIIKQVLDIESIQGL